MREESSDTPPRAFVLGFDGVPWHLVEEWVAAGHLPNFEEMLTEGAAGVLTSSKPANTPVAWPAIATGCWADKHGIHDFYKLQSNHSKRPYNRTDLDRPALWDVLTPAVVGNVPMTYPPASIDGTMVSGMMTPSTGATFTHPPAFKEELLDRLGEYTIELPWHEYRDDDDALLRDIDALLAQRRSLMQLLMESETWRLFFFVYVAPDRLQHRIWDRDRLLDHYRSLDDILGEVMAYCERLDSNLVVVSDHGFGPVSTAVHVNRLLADEGFLTERESGGGRSVLSSLGVTRSRVVDSLSATGLDVHGLAKRLPRGLVDSVAKQMPGDHGLYDVDYGRTAAFLHGQGSVYVNDTRRFEAGAVDPADVEDVKRDVMATLRGLTDPETGEAALAVHDGRGLLPNDPDGPDVVVEPRAGYTVKTSLPPDVFGEETAVVASHRPEGVFFARGPDIAPGATPDGASVVDVAPTILHLLGEPVPAETDGRVLTELFAEGSSPAVRDTEVSQYGSMATNDALDEGSADVEDRLRGLGYIE